MSQVSDQSTSGFEDTREPSVTAESTQVTPSDCGCGCAKNSATETISASESRPKVQSVYALGTLGYDFGSEARRDSIIQHVAAMDDDSQSPYDTRRLLKYLDKNPWDAPSVQWTLNLDGTPIYVIQPRGAFAATGYERLRHFLQEQVVDGVERVSIPGLLIGQARLMSGQVLPIVWPDLRGMNNWNTSALVRAVSDNQDSGGTGEQTDELAGFLERIYSGFRNLGLSPQDRALNFAGTNAANGAKVFKSALQNRMRLDTVEVERSPICRPESDCWDVRLVFFDPEHQTQRARMVYLFTADVSEPLPVMVGRVRKYPIR